MTARSGTQGARRAGHRARSACLLARLREFPRFTVRLDTQRARGYFGEHLIRSNWRMVATGVFRSRRGCAGRMMDGSAWLVAVVRCCTSLGEQVALPRDELLDGLRGSAGDFLDRGGHAVIPILAM